MEFLTDGQKQQQQIYDKSIFYFYRAFALFHKGIVITITFKMLQTFLLKIVIKALYDNKILSIQITLMGQIQPFSLKMGFPRDIDKL